jgi:hypothetical protein
MVLERFCQFEDSSSQVNEQQGRLTSRAPIVSLEMSKTIAWCLFPARTLAMKVRETRARQE